jgi:DNA-binding XRE family transcriptional regulator
MGTTFSTGRIVPLKIVLDKLRYCCTVLRMNQKVKQEPLGERLKNYRLNRGWTQERIAEELGLSRGTIANIEGGMDPLDLTRVKIEKLINGQEAA